MKKLFLIILASIFVASYLFTQKNWETPVAIIGFAGDTMLGRLVNETLRQLPISKRYTYSWSNVLPLLRANDLNIVNLETTITLSTKRVPKVFNFKTDPDHVKALSAANIDVVNIANNHILDFDVEGMNETITNLDKEGILHVGAGSTIEHARQPVVIKKNGIIIGIVGFTDNEPDWLANKYKPGTNYVEVGDIETIKKSIGDLINIVDILILSIHWGPNMRERPTQDYIDFAHAIIDAGVDIIHGHSAHIFQGIELYKKKLIMYDTGDFLDDYMVDPLLRNNLSCIFEVMVNKQGLQKVTLVPIKIENMSVTLATGQDYTWVLNKVAKLSSEMGTSIKGNEIVLDKDIF